ncbi:MAG: Cu(I)-responsive transcriptional regulator [Rhodospirillales bacterium]
MNIGEAAAESGVSAKMIRHYEAIGLIRPADRGESRYRHFGAPDVHVLRFIKRARTLGFSIKDIGSLLGLWQGHRPSAEVKRLALAHIASLDAKIAEMRGMRDALGQLARDCHGDERPECPILEDLAGPRFDN